MPRFILHHRHEARECPVVFASWKGFASPLRHRPAAASCAWGGHEIWWELEAASEQDALGHLPHYVAARTHATQIGEVEIP
jgi:hypothetical protein